MQENWKDIKGFEGRYQVSDLGRVKSLDHIDNMYWFSNGSKRVKKGRILKSHKKDGRYHVVSLFFKSLNQRYVHRLVANAFIGKIPKSMVVNHIDGDIDNNRSCNLEIITQRSNATHSRIKLKSSSRYTGVSWNKARKCWIAMLKRDGKSIYLGGFKDEIDAHEAYQNYIDSFTEIKYTIPDEIHIS